MKSILITAMLTALVAAHPQPVNLEQPDIDPVASGLLANSSTGIAGPDDACVWPCRKDCKKTAMLRWPPFFWWVAFKRCDYKCDEQCAAGGGGDEDSSGEAEVLGSDLVAINVSAEQQEKEQLDMESLD